ncbi:GntR family transcriptional regulator [Paenarthrobacter sp. Z7-10]|uniref:GntR family transcriptional regulator n=1 Tax=Paenarthrobacter sp. Z7-10 TaxID=2787635 RepID=UPI0022A93264|nr:GntR family transcriptional regulator [Paenarthrobacter sp. Z7-10]MCZ2403674.1 GntR family transcriptional regulator [Paenarthrobacter sp. Z7-10]
MALKPMIVRTKSEAAYDALREAILDQRLAPGQRVTLTTLASELGMSLTPVREALRLLAMQGLVHQDTNRGTWITEYSPARAEEVFQLRLLLEPYAIQLAAAEVTDQDLAEIDAALAEFDRASAEGRYSELPELNAALHQRIYRVSSAGMLLGFIDRLWQSIPYQSMNVISHHDRSAADHHQIVDALHRRDPVGAAQALRDHIGHAQAETIQRMERSAGITRSTHPAAPGPVTDRPPEPATVLVPDAQSKPEPVR